jgi:TRAP-type C4-dicarboxylate transport system permease large subunit
MMSSFIGGLDVPNVVIFAGVVILYIILGMFLDIISAVILTIPVIFPMVMALGFDPIWYGIVTVILVEMGLVTPPVGMDAFLLAGAIDIPVTKIFKSVMPFLAAELVCIVLLVAVPQIVLWLPGTMQ